MLVSEVLNYLNLNGVCYKVLDNRTDLKINIVKSFDNICNNSMTWVKKMDIYKISELTKHREVLIFCDLSSYTQLENIDTKKNCFILCESPRDIFFAVVKFFMYQEKSSILINEENYKGNKNVEIGNNCVISSEVEFGNNVIIGNNVTLEGYVYLGDNVVIGSNTVIGTQGFGFFNNFEGEKERVPHLGGVVIEKNVEIGSNTTIDRGTLNNTIIKARVKVSNNCAISHNVIINENTLITAGTIITGGVTINKDVYIGPGTVIRNQINIGENSYIGMGSVVVGDVERNCIVYGTPAKFVKFRE